MSSGVRKIKSALVSVYYKGNLEKIVKQLSALSIEIYSTGGTLDFIAEIGTKAESIEQLTGYPSVFGGRVKTLHPKVFGGILARRHNPNDVLQLEQYEIPQFDLVIVDLYPFEETVKSGASRDDIIEKIDIGGISLIRAAAKNHQDVLVVSSRNQYEELIQLLEQKKGETSLEDREKFATAAFKNTMEYDTAIHAYFAGAVSTDKFACTAAPAKVLRYGENPHQQGVFYGELSQVFDQLGGKEISYNNLLDIDAALGLIADFEAPTYAILKHNNACGCASDNNLLSAWQKALAGDPISAFGGIIITNREVDKACAEEINKLFFEIIIAPSYTKEAMEIFQAKKNRIILKVKPNQRMEQQFRSLLNGVLVQQTDLLVETAADLKPATGRQPSPDEIQDLLFANKLVKHSKSNAIVLAKNQQLLASGVGQTSRVDALRHAIEKAHTFNFSLEGAVMASDAFFPFPDCVEIAHEAGVKSVVQPGGSKNDQASIDYCNQVGVSMVITGNRHFKH